MDKVAMIIEVPMRHGEVLLNFKRGKGPYYVAREIEQSPLGMSKTVEILRALDGSEGWEDWRIIRLRTRSIERVYSLDDLMTPEGLREIEARHRERAPLD